MFNILLFLLSMIYVYWAPPRKGKTYSCTDDALRAMEEFHKKRKKDSNFKGRVFSNYPIKHPKLGFCDVWEPHMCEWPIYDSKIYIDEAYRDYNSRKHKMFSDDEHLFFSTNGHNGNDINLIAQNPARIDLIIREMTDTFFYIKKMEIPLVGRPLWFTLDAYLSEDDFKRRHMDKEALYNRTRKIFKAKVANAYNTHHFRKACDQEPVFVNWGEKLDLDDPINENEKSRIKTVYDRLCNRVKSQELVSNEQ
ncbi:zonular occludens toxin domain-containing protein [Methanolobus sp. ZRKC2]|uniref:zonular occludens toxin domain-containing protein n=1 Tax=Methanolobus sp. ZRKC2 TaxID=3125783 RepID=UPI0032539762